MPLINPETGAEIDIEPDGDLTAADLTFGEKARIGVLIARMAKRGIADDGTGRVDLSDLKRKVERIERQALRRKNKK